MELKTNEGLESTGYRCLLEGAEQYGTLMLHFIEDYRSVSAKGNMLSHQAVLYGRNDLLSLVKRNRSVISYLREHEKELGNFNFASKDVLDTFRSLNISNLELYLESARKLEQLGVGKIRMKKFPTFDTYECGIYRNSQGEITNIVKCYTDAAIQVVGLEYTVNEFGGNRYSKLGFNIRNQEETQTFSLDVTNKADGHQYSEIYIANKRGNR